MQVPLRLAALKRAYRHLSEDEILSVVHEADRASELKIAQGGINDPIGYMFVTRRNALIRENKQAGRQSKLARRVREYERSFGAGRVVPCDPTTPEDEVLAREAWAEFGATLLTMPTLPALVVLLRVLGIEPGQIAAFLGVDAKVAYNALHRGKASMHASLASRMGLGEEIFR